MKRFIKWLFATIIVWLGTLGILELYPLSLLGQLILIGRELLAFIMVIVAVIEYGKHIGHE